MKINRRQFTALTTGALAAGLPFRAFADETCQSPYMPMITGHEEYVYIWTLGVEGMGDEQDKLVTVDLRPGSETRGQVINAISVGGRNEAHHGGFSADRRKFWAGGLDTNKIFIFDVATDPSNPSLHMTIDTFVKDSGGCVGPHTFFALPGRMLITGLSNDADHGGRTALVEYNDEGVYVATHWMPTVDDMRGAVAVDGAVAKLLRTASAFGAVLDPLVDKLMLGCLFIIAGTLGWTSLWLVALVVGRDMALAVGVVRLELLAHSRRLEPLLIGKLCTMTQFFFFGVLLAETGGLVPFGILHYLAASAVVLTALASLAAYLWFARAGAHAKAAGV